MAAPATIDEFLDLMRKSGIADEKRLESYMQKLRAANALPKEPTKFAGLLIRDGYLTQFQAEHLLRGKWKRFSIGKYKVLERLGSGGMGAVYLCEHKLMRRRVAVKVLPPSKAQDESTLRRFEREARAAAALDHPNIVHAYDIDQDEDLHFLVMEYVDGASLQDIVKKSGPMDAVRAAHYLRQAALGLEHAHLAGLVHRDIKPGNILVDRAGVLKLLDMGLARFFKDEEDNLTRKFDENVLGTADYLAPEQAVDSHDVDIRADIYSLGATMYYCLTGKPPFGEGTVAQKLIWHQTKQPKPLQQLRPDLPEKLVGIIEKMMSKTAAQRYQRPGEIYEAIGALTDTPIAPPQTAEMPSLSLAATRGPVDNEQVTIVSQAVPQAPALPTPQPANAAAVLRAPVSSRVPLQPAGANQQVTSAPPAPKLEIAERDETWAIDTASPIDLADTTRSSESSRLRITAFDETQRNRKFLKILGVLSGIAVVLLIIACVLFFRPGGPTDGKRDTTLRVSRDAKTVSGGNVVPTIQAALAQVEKNATIEIWDTLIEENVTIDGKVINTNVTIKAAPQRVVLWKSKEKSGKSPLLMLVNAKEFHLQGDNITMNGDLPDGKRVEDLIRIQFKCPGLRIEDLSVRSFARSAMAISNCAGEPGNPVRIVHLQSNDQGNKNMPQCIIRVSAPPGTQHKVNEHIVFDETCQFLSPPKEIVKIDDPASIGAGVKLPQNAKAAATPDKSATK